MPTLYPTRIAILSAITGPETDASDPVLERVKVVASNDQELVLLHEQILNGFLNDKCNLKPILRPYWCVREKLAIDDVDEMIVMG